MNLGHVNTPAKAAFYAATKLMHVVRQSVFAHPLRYTSVTDRSTYIDLYQQCSLLAYSHISFSCTGADDEVSVSHSSYMFFQSLYLAILN